MTHLKIHRFANTLGLAVVCAILITAFAEQFVLSSEPCPLCLLQRAGFILVGMALALNIRVGIKVSHYGLMLLSSLFGFATSLRQILLHMTPGDKGYGPALFNLHLYEWSAVVFFIILGMIAIALLLDKAFIKEQRPVHLFISNCLIALFVLTILANCISTLIECGLAPCPANPISYKLIQ